MSFSFRKYTSPTAFKRRTYTPKQRQFTSRTLRKFIERVGQQQLQWSAPRSIMGMSIVSSFAFLLYAVDQFTILARYGLPRAPRSVWCLQRGSDLYRDMQSNWTQYSEAIENNKYRQKFRVTKKTFNLLAEALCSEPEFCKKSTPLREPVPAMKRLAITLHWLAKAPMFDDLADQYGIGKSTAVQIVHDCMEAMDRVLTADSIKFPTTDVEILLTMQGFSALKGLPQCAGAIDGCMISMKRPTGEFGFRYWSYKHNDYAILLLAVVDAEGLFTYINVGRPATVNDSACFQLSPLKEGLYEGSLLPSHLAMEVEGVVVKPYIVADSAFGLSPHIMKPYPGDTQPEDTPEYEFNKHQCGTRRVVENAFGRLKARWASLVQHRVGDPAFMAVVTRVACAMHNICQRNMDKFSDSWRIPEPTAQELQTAARSIAVDLDDSYCYLTADLFPTDLPSGEVVREALAKYVYRKVTEPVRLRMACG